MAAENALELVRAGRLSSPYSAPFEIVREDEIHRLRRYRSDEEVAADPIKEALIFVPPLMVASEIYDMAPEISACATLVGLGVDVWLVDFGKPEIEAGGMSRTLDDHVRAVCEAVDLVKEETGSDVHLAGYSQGGMFVYQAAAYRHSDGIASLITFGSPVDIHRNLPGVNSAVVERGVTALRAVISGPLSRIDGLPGTLTSTGFKLLSMKKELRQLADFVSKLHDRQALEKRETKRLFLGGQGFVAWPGPALRSFIDEMVVNNRMSQGGFVIDGKTLSLADITCPILYFVGKRDDMARPAAVRAIKKAAPNAESHEVLLKAGHFGLVVGSTAMAISWPTIAEWMRWRADSGPRPTAIAQPTPKVDENFEDPDVDFDFEFDLELFVDVFTNWLTTAWDRIGDAGRELVNTADNLRWQVPRLRRLRNIQPNTQFSAGRVLAEQARSNPERTFFLWKGRAFSYAEADRRVDAIVRGLVVSGVRKGEHVGVLMKGRPTYLSIVAALSRVGAVAVLLNPDTPQKLLERALDLAAVEHLIADPENAARALASFSGVTLVLGGAGRSRELPDGVVDMEAIDPTSVELPQWYSPNPGRATDLAMIVLTAGRSGEQRAARISNRRGAFGAYGAAAAATLTPKDTVYCGVPLHHAAGTLVTTGAALVGGSRLAIGAPFTPEVFWDEARRYGTTVAFYAGAMVRELVNAPYAPGENRHSIRLFAGSGLRADAWERLVDRFGPVGVLEFFASTEGTVVLANASGEKMGAVGRALPGSAEVALVAYDFEAEDYIYDSDGWYVQCADDQMGVLIARVGSSRHVAGNRIRHGVFEPDDSWFFTGDLLRRDADGDHWFIDRLANLIRTKKGPVSTVQIEGALYRAPNIALAVAYGVTLPGETEQTPVATVKLISGTDVDADILLELVDTHLDEHARPKFIRVAKKVPMTDGFRALKTPLRKAGIKKKARGVKVLRYEDQYRS